MTGKIKAVIWDMGGVLLRTEEYQSRIRAAEKYGWTLDEIEAQVFNSESAALATVGKISEPEHWINISRALKIPEGQLLTFQTQFWEGDQLDLELVDFIRGLQKRYHTALLSNAWSGARDVLTTAKPCIDAFHTVVFSCEVKLAKPDPAIYHKVLSLTGVEANEAIFVDDVQQNIDAANQLGIHGVRFMNARQAISDVKSFLET
jgi:epoxide hydrolase-like predicted phosphatase